MYFVTLIIIWLRLVNHTVEFVLILGEKLPAYYKKRAFAFLV